MVSLLGEKTNQTSFADGLADLLRISQPGLMVRWCKIHQRGSTIHPLKVVQIYKLHPQRHFELRFLPCFFCRFHADMRKTCARDWRGKCLDLGGWIFTQKPEGKLEGQQLLKMAIYSGFSHWTWWFSIVMLVYQRVECFRHIGIFEYVLISRIPLKQLLGFE